MVKVNAFNLGDRVEVKSFYDIPADLRRAATGRLCGKVGTVTDKLYSESVGQYLYKVQLDDFDAPSSKLWQADCLIPYSIPTATYSFEFEFLDNLVVAIFYETIGDQKTEVARGHGHIIHEGANGIAQASSYALKKLYEHMNGGSLV